MVTYARLASSSEIMHDESTTDAGSSVQETLVDNIKGQKISFEIWITLQGWVSGKSP